jgi:hypothetical protein
MLKTPAAVRLAHRFSHATGGLLGVARGMATGTRVGNPVLPPAYVERAAPRSLRRLRPPHHDMLIPSQAGIGLPRKRCPRPKGSGTTGRGGWLTPVPASRITGRIQALAARPARAPTRSGERATRT